ncbi:MAG: outer membrane beta-barrel protein [Vicinamibacterales bacterium]
MRHLLIVVLALVAALALPAAAAAQERERDPFEDARFRFGPLAMTPTLSISTLGVDTNVFNEWEDPKRDFTFAAGPQTEAWFRLGRARLHGHGTLEYLYFHEWASQRGLTAKGDVAFELPLARIMPYVGIAGADTNARPGFEIDARARYKENGRFAGFELRLSPKTSVDLSVRRTKTRFAGDALFMGTYLSEVLDRDTDVAKATLRFRLTPLTTLVLDADASKERFVSSPERDADSVRVMPGFDFDTFALVSGTVRLGFRRLDMQDESIPDFSGFVGQLKLGYTLLGDTRFDAGFFRDIEYSFEISQPYYVRTGYEGSITRRIVGGWDVVARAGQQRLAYRDRGAASPAFVPGAPRPDGRVDRVETYGGGVGYRFSSGTRVGLDVNQYRRRSDIDTRTYEGLRAGMVVTYGF